ncbi:MAG TPA: hypothetical protein VMF62_17430 [Acetobacteraceae bacterium]|nr:hypothetical protein [Acetobacteraceae bacterium]
MRRSAIVAVLLAGLVPPALAGGPVPVMSNAEALGQCAPAAEALPTLARHYGERPFWIGNAGGGTSVMVTREPSGKTWTLLAIGRDGDGEAIACVLAAGGAAIDAVPTQ